MSHAPPLTSDNSDPAPFSADKPGLTPWGRLCAILLVGMALFLGIRAHDEYRWSDWEFGDAQTMLSLRQWQEGGWIENHLLFKPQGYAPVIDLLDRPELRHHAHGTSPETSPRVGPRLLYTHYPAGYLIPYALFFKIGIDGIFAMRLLSILFSVSALALMYLLFATLVSPRVSLAAVLFYALSSSFLGFADSLANQPLDDLLRFGFMAAVVFSTRGKDSAVRRRWAITAWIVQFALSLSSFDSVFFLYTWLIGWDILEKKGFRWKRYLLFAAAPVLAHSLQFVQNIWYLGVNDAWRDIVDTFTLKHGARGGGGGRAGAVMMALVAVCYMVYSPGLALLAMLGLYLAGYRWVERGDHPLPSPGLLLLLFVCGAGFELALPRAALISSYEGRQMIPFASLLVSGFTWLAVEWWGEGDKAVATGRRLIGLGARGIALLVVVLFWGWFGVSNRFEKKMSVSAADVALAQSLRTMPVGYEPVYFSVEGFTSYLDPDYVHGYPQIRPETEYYAGSRLILCFATPELLGQDLAVMAKSATVRFSPVLVADGLATMNRALALLQGQGIITPLSEPSHLKEIDGRQVLDLTAMVNWEAADR